MGEQTPTRAGRMRAAERKGEPDRAIPTTGSISTICSDSGKAPRARPSIPKPRPPIRPRFAVSSTTSTRGATTGQSKLQARYRAQAETRAGTTFRLSRTRARATPCSRSTIYAKRCRWIPATPTTHASNERFAKRGKPTSRKARNEGSRGAASIPPPSAAACSLRRCSADPTASDSKAPLRKDCA